MGASWWRSRGPFPRILSLTFERRASFRRLKPQRRSVALRLRAYGELKFVDPRPASGRGLLLDTCVYIDVLQGGVPAEVKRLLEMRIVNHSAIALAELTHLIGALDPAHPGTAQALKRLGEVIDNIPARRLSAPSVRACGEAGMLAGLVTRLAGRHKDFLLLNDAMLFLQAAEMGCELLTGNVAEFDWFDQIVPGTGVIFYRKE